MHSLLWPGLVMPMAAGCMPRSFFPRPGPLEKAVLSGHGRTEDLAGIVRLLSAMGIMNTIHGENGSAAHAQH